MLLSFFLDSCIWEAKQSLVLTGLLGYHFIARAANLARQVRTSQRRIKFGVLVPVRGFLPVVVHYLRSNSGRQPAHGLCPVASFLNSLLLFFYGLLIRKLPFDWTYIRFFYQTCFKILREFFFSVFQRIFFPFTWMLLYIKRREGCFVIKGSQVSDDLLGFSVHFLLGVLQVDVGNHVLHLLLF